tara:strand:- start:783 stop:2165 length:1383 start_codon:yes stop_codon:yes gene_type:complete
MKNSLVNLDIASHLHPQSDPRVLELEGPLVMTRGNGASVCDSEGREYLDGMAGLWCASLGFDDQRLREAAFQQFEALSTYHAFNYRTNPPAIELSSEILALADMPDGKVFFTNSGSDAVDTMIKMAWYYNISRGMPQKRRIISRTKAYHGSTVLGAVLSGLPQMHKNFNLPDLNVIYTDPPYHYRYARRQEDPIAFGKRLAQELDDLIVRENPDTIAAMIVEPVMGAGGVIVPPENYLIEVEKVLRSHDILMLSDEVICGFGRTGEWFGSQSFKSSPDMLSLAKGITSGYFPMGAVVIDNKIYQSIAESAHDVGVFSHGFTYSAHPVGAAIALSTLAALREMDAPAVAANLGACLQSELASSLSGHANLGEIRSRGFMAGVEIVADPSDGTAFPRDMAVGQRIERVCRANGLILRNLGDTISICPPYIVTREQVHFIAKVLTKAIDEVCEVARRELSVAG